MTIFNSEEFTKALKAESPAPLSAPVNTTTSTAEGRTLACSTDESCSEDGVKATRIGTGKPIAAQLVGGAAPLSEEAPTPQKETLTFYEISGTEAGPKLALKEIPATKFGMDKTHPEAICPLCGRENPCWFAPNEVWNKVVPERSGIMCPICFMEKAQRCGIEAWELRPDPAVGGKSAAFSEEEARREFEAFWKDFPYAASAGENAKKVAEEIFKAGLACAKKRAEG